MKEWLLLQVDGQPIQVGYKFTGNDGEIYTVKEAESEFKCRRCKKKIYIDWPYAKGRWGYLKYHITCAREG